MAKISVFMFSYNHAPFLRDSIESVLAQTCHDFELLIIDDASTDNSWNIIQDYSDPRIKAFKNSTNQNDKQSVISRLLEISTGEYIAIHHSDNKWLPEKLECQVEFLDSHPEISAVFTHAAIIDENDQPLTDQTNFFFNIFEQPNRTRHEWLHYFFYHGNALCHPSILIRRKSHEAICPHRKGFAQIPDLDMWIRLCLFSDIHIIQEKLTYYRVPSHINFTNVYHPNNRRRYRFELLQILNHYRNIHEFDELVKIFPDAKHYENPDGNEVNFVLAMIALEIANGNPMHHLFGLNLLFDLLNEPAKAQRIQQLYGFGQKDYIKLTAEKNIFSIEEIIVLQKQINTIKSHWFLKLFNHVIRFITFPVRKLQHTIQAHRYLDLIKSSDLFNEGWYLAHNRDVAQSKIDPAKHYLLMGGIEGRDPGPNFSSRAYLESYPDVRKRSINPLVHHLSKKKP